MTFPALLRQGFSCIQARPLALGGMLLCSLLIFGPGATAQTVSALPAPAASAISFGLGALILSPAQRRALETARNAPDASDDLSLLSNRPSGTSPAIADTLVITGMVLRSGNRSTVWINDEPLYGKGPLTALRTLAGEAGVLQQDSNEMSVVKKPGQVVDVPSRQVVDLLPPGSITVIPAKVAPTRSKN